MYRGCSKKIKLKSKGIGVKVSKIQNYNKRGGIKYYKYINKKNLKLI